MYSWFVLAMWFLHITLVDTTFDFVKTCIKYVCVQCSIKELKDVGNDSRLSQLYEY